MASLASYLVESIWILLLHLGEASQASSPVRMLSSLAGYLTETIGVLLLQLGKASESRMMGSRLFHGLLRGCAPSRMRNPSGVARNIAQPHGIFLYTCKLFAGHERW